MSNNRLLELITRKLAGEATLEELEELKTTFPGNADALENYKLLQRYWDEHEHVNQVFIEGAYEKIAHRLDLQDNRPVVEMKHTKSFANIKRLLYTVTAAAVILVAAVILYYNPADTPDGFSTPQTALVEKQSPKGSKQNFLLADGSKVWLNADSKIQFPKKFEGKTREVYLNGEAFFEVAKNAEKPFIIHLANGTVKVLGTSFNVRAYDNEEIIETSVATGKVAFIPKYVRSGKKQDTVFLLPDNKVRYLFSKEEVTVEPTVSKEDRAWIAGKLVFKGMTFEEIGVELERNFGKKIVFVSDTARMFRLTGAFQDNSLEEILFYLSKSKEFHYKVTDGEVLIGDAATGLPD